MPSRDHPERRRGMTLIELLIVVAIATALAGMGITGMNQALSRSALDRAAFGLRDLADQAQSLARKTNSDSARTHYGIAIYLADDGSHRASMIRFRHGDGKSSDRERAFGDPLVLPRRLRIHVGENALGESGAPVELAWFYQPVTGLPQLREGDAFGPAAATVGIPAPVLFESGKALHFGATPDPLPALAPDGLSIFAGGDSKRRWIQMAATGSLSVREQ